MNQLMLQKKDEKVHGWTFMIDEQLIKLNLASEEEPNIMLVSAKILIASMGQIQQLCSKFLNVFKWS